jgi:MFS family permease
VLRLAQVVGIRSGNRPAVYYGWPMLLATALAQVTSWGILYYSFAVFIAPMHAETGWSIAQMTGAYSLALLLSGVAGVPVGRWLDRHGPRALMTAGSVLATLLVLAWSRVDSLLGFYLIWAGIGLAMSAIFYEPAFYIVANWFHRLRSRALTLLTFIGGLASVVYIPLAAMLVDRLGWRDALLVLAVILCLGTLPIHALLLRRHPGDLGLEPDGGPGPSVTQRVLPRVRSLTTRQALHDASFWWLAAAFFLANVATMAITVHLIPLLTERGYSAGFAAGAAGAVGLLGLPGRLIFTPLGSRIERRKVTALIFFLQTLSLLVLIAAPGTAGIIVFVVLFGAGFGAITPARAAMVAELYGPAHYGSIGGILALFITAARATAPVGAGLLYTGFDSYAPVLWTILLMSGVAVAAALQARPPSLLTNEEIGTGTP